MSDVDFEKWARRDTLSLEECVMLLLGVEPSDVIPPRLKKSFDDIYETALRSIRAGTLLARPVHTMGWRTLDGRGQSRSTAWMVSTPALLPWAREKYPVLQGLEEAVNRFHPEPKDRPQGDAELAGIASPRPADEAQPSRSIAPDNEPTVKRKAPDVFIAALIRLLVEISKRAAENGRPFDPNAMPGTKADFMELAIKFDSKFNKAPSTFSDYLDGLLWFKQGARATTFYRELFPDLFT